MNALGRHIIVELFDCVPALLDDVTHVQDAMRYAAEQVGATIINLTFHHFSPFGVSGVVVIQESHLAIHTWPEWGFASIDLFTCGDMIDPWRCYAILKKAFEANHGSAIEMRRGQLDLLEKKNYLSHVSRPAAPLIQTGNTISREIWFTERDENLALSLKHTGKLLYKSESEYQKIEIFETFAFGKALVLDGLVVATEKDEAAYHEMLVHPALSTYANPKKVLIIGGGDGGTAREVLRYPSVEKVIMIEQDAQVTQAAKAHFPTLAQALEHPALEIIFADAISYIHVLTNDKKQELFDVILVDAADTAEKPILDEVFFQMLVGLLHSNGVLATQCDAPRWHQARFVEIIKILKIIFGENNTRPYLSYVASLPTGMWAFALAAKNEQFYQTANSIVLPFETQLKYYNSAVHQAAFALPNFIQDVLK